MSLKLKLSKPTRDALRSARNVGLFSFVSTFGTSLLTWLQHVTDWATSGDGKVVFPDPSVLSKALVAAVVGSFALFLTAAVRLAQTHGALFGKPPTYPTNP